MSGSLPNPALEAQLLATGLPREEGLIALTEEETAAGRECGPCGLCCRLVGVPELDNPPGVTCGHLRPGGAGCAVYRRRPGGCRVYACAWKLGLGAEEERPDLAGGLLEWHELAPTVHPHGGYWVFRVEGTVPTGVGVRLLDGLRAIGCLVLVYRGPEQPMTMYYPDGSEDPDAGIAPSWADEQRGLPMELRIAEYGSYCDDLEPEVRGAIERVRGPT